MAFDCGREKRRPFRTVVAKQDRAAEGARPEGMEIWLKHWQLGVMKSYQVNNLGSDSDARK